MSSKRLAMDGLLAAMCAVLGALSIDLGVMKFTLENFPILVGAFLFGPIDGLMIGGIGTFLYQVLKYGLEVSTPLWIFPYMIGGFVAGWLAKRIAEKKRMISIVLIVVFNGLIVTICNTIGLIIYYLWILDAPIETVLAAIPTRLITSVLKSVAFGFLLPPVLKGVQKIGQKTFKNE